MIFIKEERTHVFIVVAALIHHSRPASSDVQVVRHVWCARGVQQTFGCFSTRMFVRYEGEGHARVLLFRRILRKRVLHCLGCVLHAFTRRLLRTK